MLYSETASESESARIVNIKTLGTILVYNKWAKSVRDPFYVEIIDRSHGIVTEHFVTYDEGRNFVAKFLTAHSLCKKHDLGPIIWNREMIESNFLVDMCDSCGADRVQWEQNDYGLMDMTEEDYK